MGSSVSIDQPTSAMLIKDGEALAAVQKFTELAYDVSPKNETLTTILTNTLGRKAFVEFLKSEKSGSVGANFISVKQSFTNESGAPLAENLLFDYHLPAVETEVLEVSNIAENVHMLLHGEREMNNEEIASLLDSSKNESIILLSIEALPRFIASPFFKAWQSAETSRAVAITSNASDVNVTIPEILAADPSLIDSIIVPTEAQFVSRSVEVLPADNGAGLLGSSVKKIGGSGVDVSKAMVVEAVAVTGPPEDDFMEIAMKNVDYLEIDRILRSGSWLFTFVASVENLPICITLSTARKDRIGFPLIYVNRFFESTSGYSRTDIMGANCKFLQRDGSGIIRSETDSVERLSTALRNAESIKVAITNFRRDGTPFKNLLAIKPVFDMKGEYEYVIGVQFDISSQRSSSYALRLVDALVKMLPSVVVN